MPLKQVCHWKICCTSDWGKNIFPWWFTFVVRDTQMPNTRTPANAVSEHVLSVSQPWLTRYCTVFKKMYSWPRHLNYEYRSADLAGSKLRIHCCVVRTFFVDLNRRRAIVEPRLDLWTWTSRLPPVSKFAQFLPLRVHWAKWPKRTRRHLQIKKIIKFILFQIFFSSEELVSFHSNHESELHHSRFSPRRYESKLNMLSKTPQKPAIWRMIQGALQCPWSIESMPSQVQHQHPNLPIPFGHSKNHHLLPAQRRPFRRAPIQQMIAVAFFQSRVAS
jgi:hypothetical protein